MTVEFYKQTGMPLADGGQLPLPGIEYPYPSARKETVLSVGTKESKKINESKMSQEKGNNG